jgi:signal transduction histidine kinase
VEHKSCSFREVELGDKRVRVFLSPIFDGPDLRGNLLTLEDITEKAEQEHAREQFLSFLVHELRTPLTAIRSNSALVQEHFAALAKDNEDLQEILADINSGSKYVLEMVNQFLDMARLEEGRIKFDLKQFELVQVIRETVASLEVLAKDRGLSLTFDAPQDMGVQVAADIGRTKQVLTNLIGNGLKFTEKGGVTVSLAVKDDLAEISVKDTGAGIPEDSQKKMFQKYFQASNNKMATDSSKSTGLGLYVTKLMVEGMGGTIALTNSQVNEGSTFTFTLHLATQEWLKQVSKLIADAEQGVQHAQVPEHSSTSLA